MKMHNNIMTLSPDAADGSGGSDSSTEETNAGTLGTEDVSQGDAARSGEEIPDEASVIAEQVLKRIEKGDLQELQLTEEEEDESEVEGDESSSDPKESDETAEESEETQDATEEPEEQSSEEEPPPFHEHPRWQEKVKEAEELKAELATAKEFQKSFTEQGATKAQVDEALSIAGMLDRGEFEQAKAKLAPYLEMIETGTGERLPEDLAVKVEDGKMELDDAQELAKLRAGTQRNTQSAAQATQEKFFLGVQNELGNWEKAKATSDPAWAQKQQFVNSELAKLATLPGNQIARPSDIVALAEKAYGNVEKLLTPFAAKPKTRSNKPSLTHRKKQKQSEPKTIEEAALAAYAPHMKDD